MSRSIRVARPKPPPPRTAPLALERVVTPLCALVLILGMFVPLSVFGATRAWTLTRTPALVTGGAPASVQVTATNTGDDGGGEAIGCVIITIPASAFTVTGVAIDSVSDGDPWSASFSGDGTSWFVRLTSNTAGQNRLHQLESVTASITFNDTGLDGTFTWTGDAFNQIGCTDSSWPQQTVSVTIDGAVVNNAPVAQPDSYPTGRNTAITLPAPGVLANDTDPDGDPLTATQTSSPANGTLAWGGDGAFTYTPDPGFVGTDSFTYHADDASASTADVLVTLTVTNGAPVPADDVYSTAWAQALVVSAPGILSNDTDPDGDALVASIVSGPSNGTLLPDPDGSFTYFPDLLFIGTDSFTYAAGDGVDTVQATVFINVANAAPVASADGPYAATEDATLNVPAAGVLANDTDGDGDPLNALLVTNATNGAVTLQADGSFDYVPGPDFAGTDSFTYRASDGLDTSTATTVSITVAPVNDAPAAVPDAKAAGHATSVLIDVLANDTDADGDVLDITAVGTPSAGSATIESGRVRYTPPAGFAGSATFAYTTSDGSATDSATVTVTVAPEPTPLPTPTPPAPPVAIPVPSPSPTADPPATEPSPAEPPQPAASPSPTGTPEPDDPSPSPMPSASPSVTPTPSDEGTADLQPLPSAQVTTGIGPDDGTFEFAGLFGGFSGSFSWAMPAAMLGVPGLLFMVAVAGQLIGAAAWVPTIKRMLAGVGVRRRRRD